MATIPAGQGVRRRTAAQWTAENPVLRVGELGFERDTGLLKIGDGTTTWNSRPYINDIAELAADDPAEVDLDTVGDVTTLTLTDIIARNAMRMETVGDYYADTLAAMSAQTLTLNQLILGRRWLSKGTIDRIATDVAVVGGAGSIIRVAVATEASGYPSNLLGAEGTIDSNALNLQAATVNITVPTNGPYWLCAVNQVGAAQVNAPTSIGNNPLPLPLGTAPTLGTTNIQNRHINSVTGAIPSPITAPSTTLAAGARFRWLLRYSSVG